ncbi:hypothetical protein PG993_006953 [Apiospora rasikravindrae]|uniref:Cytidyltransferase-like domain-containing protein n=1 Tax=Apiospora rasikravindrae TaxID=990691 RepID=A0ABR1SWD7_9PEZI
MFKKYLDKMMPTTSPPPETARLDDYIRKAWTKDPSVKPFNTEGSEPNALPPPTLRRDRKNRIIYYIGSFNPPHAGHAALLDHIYQHSRSPTSFNAVAVLVLAHGESWVRRKVRNDPEPLHLTFERRRRLLEDGLGAERRRWLWVLPRDVNAWWVFQTKLHDACARDGFALEFHELLGPDYVRADRPQCHGWHGVVTSNICRPADFDAGDAQALLPMTEFQPWEQERRQEQGQEATLTAADEDEDGDEVWTCRKQVQGQDYSIRYIRTKHPTLAPDTSSTKLRTIIAASPPDELADNLRGIAMNPELLCQVLRETAE